MKSTFLINLYWILHLFTNLNAYNWETKIGKPNFKSKYTYQNVSQKEKLFNIFSNI